MTINRLIILTILLSFISFNSYSKGLSRIKSDNRLALIIGNADYEVGELRNPINDANDMAQVLGNLGFRVILKKNANKKTMMKAIKEFGQGLGNPKKIIVPESNSARERLDTNKPFFQTW